MSESESRVVPVTTLRSLVQFALAVLDGYRTGEPGDIDGGWLQDKALELGLLVASEHEGDPNFYISPALDALLVSTRRDQPAQEKEDLSRVDSVPGSPEGMSKGVYWFVAYMGFCILVAGVQTVVTPVPFWLSLLADMGLAAACVVVFALFIRALDGKWLWE